MGRKAWRDYLTEHSGLPGPRGNLELAQAVALEGNEAMFAGYLAEFTPLVAPVNSPQEFLYFCGVLGLGRIVAEGRREYLEQLQRSASDPRWRTREGVAMALQNWADPPLASSRNQNLSALLEEMERWIQGNYFEQRARNGCGVRAAPADRCCHRPAYIHTSRQDHRRVGKRQQPARRWLPGIAQSPGIRLECSGVSFS